MTERKYVLVEAILGSDAEILRIRRAVATRNFGGVCRARRDSGEPKVPPRVARRTAGVTPKRAE